MNLPYRKGDRYRCFVVTKNDRGWGGPHGQYRRDVEWTCEECSFVIKGSDQWSLARMADHHECGHAPCDRCEKPLLRRKDGTPREHSWRYCPGKNAGDKFIYVPKKEVTNGRA